MVQSLFSCFQMLSDTATVTFKSHCSFVFFPFQWNVAYQDQSYYYRDFGHGGYGAYWWGNLEQEETDAALAVFTKTIYLLMSFKSYKLHLMLWPISFVVFNNFDTENQVTFQDFYSKYFLEIVFFTTVLQLLKNIQYFAQF